MKTNEIFPSCAENILVLHEKPGSAIAVEGTVTEWHGVGIGKMKYFQEMYGQEAIDMMMSVKTALDPDNIMNPGKVFNLWEIGIPNTKFMKTALSFV